MNITKDPRAGVIQEAGSSTVEMLEGFSSDLTAAMLQEAD